MTYHGFVTRLTRRYH